MTKYFACLALFLCITSGAFAQTQKDADDMEKEAKQSRTDVDDYVTNTFNPALKAAQKRHEDLVTEFAGYLDANKLNQMDIAALSSEFAGYDVADWNRQTVHELGGSAFFSSKGYSILGDAEYILSDWPKAYEQYDTARYYGLSSYGWYGLANTYVTEGNGYLDNADAILKKYR